MFAVPAFLRGLRCTKKVGHKRKSDDKNKQFTRPPAGTLSSAKNLVLQILHFVQDDRLVQDDSACSG